jgi:hypothetical protein
MTRTIRVPQLAFVGAFTALAAVLLFASAAFACTNLAELNLASSAGSAGSQVTVNGSAFADPSSNSPVALHWNGDNGPVIQTVTPDMAGAIGPITITIPADASPGPYVIVASQVENGTGRTPWGLPARASFTVTGPGAVAPARPTVLPATSSGNPSGSLVALTLALGFGGILLFAFGAATFVRSARRRVAAPSRVRNP